MFSKFLFAFIIFIPSLVVAEEYVRLTKNDKGQPQSLDVSITRFRSEAGAIVDLVGVVHIADSAYYKKLNQRFDKYSAVLYELIIPDDSPPDLEQRGESSLGSFQQGIGDFLELSFQLEGIDYNRENFIHADLSLVALKKAMQENKSTVAQLFTSALTASYQKQLRDYKQSQALSLKLLLGILSPNRGKIIKRAVAADLADIEKQMDLFGKDLNDLLIVERNTAALSVLEEQLRLNPQAKLAIFYGAAHMPDFVARLPKDLKRVQTEWLVAWDLQ